MRYDLFNFLRVLDVIFRTGMLLCRAHHFLVGVYGDQLLDKNKKTAAPKSSSVAIGRTAALFTGSNWQSLLGTMTGFCCLLGRYDGFFIAEHFIDKSLYKQKLLGAAGCQLGSQSRID